MLWEEELYSKGLHLHLDDGIFGLVLVAIICDQMGGQWGQIILALAFFRKLTLDT